MLKKKKNVQLDNDEEIGERICECCREISQQYQVEILREAEIGRGLFRGPSFRRTRGLPSGRIPGKEQELPPS